MATVDADKPLSAAAPLDGRRHGREDTLAAPPPRPSSKAGRGSSIATSTATASSDDVRLSGDGALDRLRSRGSDDGHSAHSSRSPSRSQPQSQRRRNKPSMSSLFKGRRSRRRPSQQSDDISPMASAAELDAPPVPPVPSGSSSIARHRSDESLGLAKSVSSSLLTEDSDVDISPARPGISPHQSHTGLLTLSSPLINSETLDSSTLGSSDASAADQASTPRAARAFDAATAITTTTTTAKKPVTSVGKLKEAFAPSRRPASPGATASAPDGVRPSSSSGALGALFGAKKRETNVLPDAVLQASPPSYLADKDTQSTASLPAAAPIRILTQPPATPPNHGAAPTTLVTPPTPTDVRPASPTASTYGLKNGAKQASAASDPNTKVSPSGNMIAHRRARSATNPPSKLSSIVSAPLTPTLEEIKTPGGTALPAQSNGFFSSVFSAAQNAASTLSTTITNSGGKQNKLAEPQTPKATAAEAGGEQVIVTGASESAGDAGAEKRRLAVETLGSGNLSLAHLGISDETPSSMAASANSPIKSDEASAKAADMAAAQAVSAAYAAQKTPTASAERPRSLTTTSAEAPSPPRNGEAADSPAATPVQRQGSIRSRISGGRRRRHRGSSATTGNTIAAAIGASTSTLAPQAALSGQRTNGTGFAVAPPRRNRDFHGLFKSVPEDDYLIEDYSAALQKEILLQGRLYVSEGHLCFSSNILGWVTNLVISFDEVVSVEKKSTAVVFPNAIVIQTLNARNVFASFLTRDATYDLIIGIWKISHPNLKSSLNGVTVDGAGTGDKTEKADSVGDEDASIQDSDDEVYDEDAEDDEGEGSFTEAGDGSVVGSEHDAGAAEARKVSTNVAQAVSGGPAKLSEPAEAAVAGAPAVQDYPGPATHAATDCGDGDQHYEKLLMDTTLPAPLGKMYSMMFGPASGVFMKKWLVEDQKSLELQMEDDGKGLGEGKKTFTFNYIKPLGGSIGPKQTKTITTMTLEQYDLDKVVSVLCSTQTPDVPSGGIFVVKTRYCLMWAPNNGTRLVMTFTVEWSGKSWLKGPIEKGANDGQLSYATSLAAALRSAVASKAGTRAVGGKPGKSKKRSKTQTLDDNAPATAAAPTPASAQANAKSWGLLDPLRSLLGPVADIIDPLFTSQGLVLLLFTLLLYSWFFRGPSSMSPSSFAHPGASPAHRRLAYEELWRAEEAELWQWLEDRVALDHRRHSSDRHAAAGRPGSRDREREMERLLGREKDSLRAAHIDEAIRTTEERLQELKGVVERERREKHGEGKHEKTQDKQQHEKAKR